jgi:hypothetical protein
VHIDFSGSFTCRQLLQTVSHGDEVTPKERRTSTHTYTILIHIDIQRDTKF